MSTRAAVYIGSILFHMGIAAAVVGIQPPTFLTPVSITIHETRPPPPPPKPPTPPPPKPEEPVKQPAPKPAPRPPPAPKAAPPPKAAPAPAPVAAAAAPEFGVQLAGASGPGGIAVPVGNPHADPVRHVVQKVLSAAPVQAKTEECSEPAAKPKPVQVSQPSYPEEARAAGVQGKVRVELTVDTTGAVAQARVVEGLGHGLDEAAIEAARTYRFEPATRCGKAVSATFTIAIRFTI